MGKSLVCVCKAWLTLLLVWVFSANSWAVISLEDDHANASPKYNHKIVQGPRYKEGELLVKLEPHARTWNADRVKATLGADRAVQFKRMRSTRGAEMDRWWILTLPKGRSVEEAAQALAARPDVEYAELNYEVHLDYTPSDPRFPELWGMNNIGQTGGVADADIDAVEAWNQHRGSSSVVVAVIDSGVDYTHEDLAANMWTNDAEIPGNGIDDDGNGYIDDIYGYDFYNNDADPFDDHGHGTHCAGTIAAVGDNNVGVAGVGWPTKIMAVKFFSKEGFATIDGAVAAIIYATNMGANVMSNSWGGGAFSQSLKDAITAANDAGILFVAAAGNDAWDNDVFDHYPSDYDVPNIVSVAATDHADEMADFSNFGENSVHLGAPGVSVLSTVPIGACSLCDPSGYVHLNGTSMATPHVSGAAALLWARFPSLTQDEVKSRLLESVDSVSSMVGATVSGGRLNINNALDIAGYASSMEPYSHNIERNVSVNYTLNFTSTTSSDDTLQLSLDSVSPGLSASLSGSSLFLPANGNASATVTVSADSSVARGVYPIRVLIDSSSGLTSTLESQLRILVPEHVLNVDPAHQYVPLGGGVSYDVEVSSIDAFAGTVTLESSVSDATLASVISPVSVDVPEDGKVNATLTVTSTTDTPLLTHTIDVLAVHESTTKVVSVQLNVAEIDLAPVSASPSSDTIEIGEGFVLSDTVINNGRVATLGGFTIGYYLSDDEILTSDDVYLGDRSVDGLDAGLSHSESTNLTMPLYTAPGDYYLLVAVDDNGTEAEVNEDNNILAISVGVAATPDVCPSSCPFTSIQAALDAAPIDGIVIVDDGVYAEAITLALGKTLISLNGPQATVIDATGLGVTAVDVTEGRIIGFTVSGGSSENGGGIMVTENAIIDNSVIRDNVATLDGGGLYVLNNSHTVTVTNSVFHNNVAGANGGGVFIGDNVRISTIIKNSQFYHNTAQAGGGIFFHEYARMSPIVENVLVVDNEATTGGGLYVSKYNYMVLVNSTISNNTDTGIYVDPYHSSTISNSIIWGNSVDATLDTYGGAVVSYSILEIDIDGEGNMVVDPQFVDAANRDYHLSEGSPAIDAGGDSGLPDDLEGRSRPQDGDGMGAGAIGDGSDYDIGAYEYEPSDVLPQAEPPAISPAGGVFGSSVTVSLSHALSEARLYYTLDGSIPTEAGGILYTAPFALTADAVVYAFAVAEGYEDSDIAMAAFTVRPVDLDTDGDGMPDIWEITNGLDPNADDASLDSDGDGWDNYFEYLYDADPQNPAFYPPYEYVVLNADLSSGSASVVSLADGNVITAGATLLNLDLNQRGSLPGADLGVGTVIRGSEPFSIGSTENATDSPVPMVMQGAAFVNPHYRDDHDYLIYSPGGVANVSIQVAGEVSTLSVAQGQVVTHQVSGQNDQSTLITSDLPILVAHRGHIQGGNRRDVYPVPPAGLELFGVRTNSAFVGALEDNTAVTIYGSNGNNQSVVLNAGDRVSVTAAAKGNEGTGDGVRIVADKPVGAAQFADSDGIDATAFLPSRYLGSRYGLPEASQYVVVVCPQANTTVTLYDSAATTEVCGGDGVSTPGKAYFGTSVDGAHIGAGAYLESDQDVYVIYEDSASNEERNVFGQ